MIHVSNVQANWILDSRGLPTISCVVEINQNGFITSGEASVPSGASTGSHEALELRDGDENFYGKGVTKAINNINSIIAPRLIAVNFTSAKEVDEYILTLDETKNKSFLGANAMLAVSLATHRAYANLFSLDLWQYLRRLYFSHLPAIVKYPRLMCNIINGGKHADNNLAIQEFMIVPNTSNVESDIQLASEVYHALKLNLKNDSLSTGLGDEGGFAPNIDGTKKALEYIQKAVFDAGYSNVDCQFAIDAAASEFYTEDAKTYWVDNQEFTVTALIDFYKDLVENYHLISIEDGLSEDDIIGWSVATTVLGKKINLVGDDLFVTNTERFTNLALGEGLANTILIKPNQIGSVLETANVVNLAKENEYQIIFSHRSGETNDDFITDFAFAAQSEFIKLGAPARGERVAKFNRLLEIKRSLDNN